jgi:hypothetical protein
VAELVIPGLSVVNGFQIQIYETIEVEDSSSSICVASQKLLASKAMIDQGLLNRDLLTGDGILFSKNEPEDFNRYAQEWDNIKIEYLRTLDYLANIPAITLKEEEYSLHKSLLNYAINNRISCDITTPKDSVTAMILEFCRFSMSQEQASIM